MDKIRNAAIIILGMGEKAAAEILKNMSPKEVRTIIEAINTIENVKEEDVKRALRDFFADSDTSSGIDIAQKEQMKNSLITAMGNRGMTSLIEGIGDDKDEWLELIKTQSMESIVELIQEEHPQVITAIVIIIFNNVSSDAGTKLIKLMAKPLQNQVFRRMSGLGSLSKAAIDSIAIFFRKELSDSDKNNSVTVDGLDTVANIVSYLDSQTVHDIMNDLMSDNKALGEKIQDKMFPFQKLAELDRKSLQMLLSEVQSDDLVLALKGAEDHVKEVFMQNMSSKAAEILRDDLETKGPVKIGQVLDAQKRIIRLAKKLDEEQKIILSTKNNPDIVF